jgi:hypothetical protein
MATPRDLRLALPPNSDGQMGNLLLTTSLIGGQGLVVPAMVCLACWGSRRIPGVVQGKDIANFKRFLMSVWYRHGFNNF